MASDIGRQLREQEALEATVRLLWKTDFDGFSVRDDDVLLCDGDIVTEPRIRAEFDEFVRRQQPEVPVPTIDAVPVPSGYVFMDGRWQDPTTLELIEVLRDGLLIKRRHVDLLPYDELVVLP